MKNLKRTLSLLLTLILALSATAFANAFTDVPEDAPYADAIRWAAENGYVNGYPDGSFGVSDPLTRAHMATVLYRTAGSPAVSGSTRYTDVAAGAYYEDAALWVASAGLINGYTDGRFGGNDPVTREQLAAILHRWAGSPAAAAGTYADRAAVSAYAQTAVDWAVAQGLVVLRADGGYAPKASATRVEIVSALHSYLTRSSAKVLVAYFSATGNTEGVAEAIADTLHADLFELIPAAPYTDADLNWTNASSRVNAEHENPARQNVALAKDTVDNWADYDVVFVGYPIWWGIAAWPVNDFIQSNDFSGKTVIPFCTSASSGLGQSGELLEEMAGAGNWLEGRRFSERFSAADVQSWVNSLNLSKAPAESQQPTEPQQPETGKTLVVYFSMPETASADDMTTEEDNSVVVINGEVLGNTQYMAMVIQETAGADLCRIEPSIPYPTDHSALVSLAREEQDQDARPAIKDAIPGFDQYDTVFVGYPIWWSDMPQILYTFFDTYDFSGKTVIPFSTHGGSNFAGTPATIRRLEPNAEMLPGLTISRDHIADARQEIVDWVNSLHY